MIGETRTGHAAGVTTVWVIGAGGQVGRAVLDGAPAVGDAADVEVRALTSADIDIADAASVGSALADLAHDDVVLNCAAHTDVDGAESDPDAAVAANIDGPQHLAGLTVDRGAWLIHLSTDYVYAGPAAIDLVDGGVGALRRTPYEPADAPGPQEPPTVYGRTKLAGEVAAHAIDPRTTIVRTAGVFTGGADSSDFVGTMRRLERSRDTITVVDDQTGSPTYSRDLADGLWQLIGAGPGPLRAGQTVHATNLGAVTWFEVARAVFVEVGADPERVQPCTTAEFPRPAPRPAYSVLSEASWRGAGLTPLRDWRTAVTAAIAYA